VDASDNAGNACVQAKRCIVLERIDLIESPVCGRAAKSMGGVRRRNFNNGSVLFHLFQQAQTVLNQPIILRSVYHARCMAR